MARLTKHGVISETGRAPRQVDAIERRWERKRPLIHVSLSPDAIARLDEIARDRGTTRSGAVEQLIRRARLREDDSR